MNRWARGRVHRSAWVCKPEAVEPNGPWFPASQKGHRAQGSQLRDQGSKTRVWILALALASCVVLDKTDVFCFFTNDTDVKDTYSRSPSCRQQNEEPTPSMYHFTVHSGHSVTTLSSIFYIILSPRCTFNIIVRVFSTPPDKETFQVPGLRVSYLTTCQDSDAQRDFRA